MNLSLKEYIFLILFHFLIGLACYIVTPLSKIYGALVLLVGFFYILKNKNRNNEVLIVAAYVVGLEIFLRITGGIILYEYGKYSVMFFMLIGIFYSGFSKNALPFWFYFALLIPGILVATETLSEHSEMRKTIIFNISGPFCLGLASIYCYNRRITINQLNNVLLFMALPILTVAVYLILYTPNLKEVLTGTGSNYQTSGGFGPNQVSTILGLGMFIFFSRLFLVSKDKILLAINLGLVFLLSYRTLLTFSRGGFLTGLVMMVLLVLYVYYKIKPSERFKLIRYIAFSVIVGFLIWGYTSTQTDGLIDKRYANQDAAGRTKESQFSGREKIAGIEMDAFVDNPVFGIGVAKGTELRKELLGGQIVISHNEITRTMAEHGAFGIVALLIVFFTPLILYVDNKENVYIFCFVIFWLMTINHAAMRLAAPAFIYSLSLLKVFISDEKNIVHRK